MGQLTAASGFLSEAVSLAAQLGDPALKAGALCQLGTVLIASDVDKAVKHLQESVDLREEQVGRGQGGGGTAFLLVEQL